MRRAADSRPDAPASWPDDPFRRKHPRIVEMLSDDRWEDGSERELSSLSLKWQEGHVLAVLNDQDLKRSLYVAATGVPEALQALERQLEAGTGDWRKWGARTKKK